jgi:hypothetical protein
MTETSADTGLLSEARRLIDLARDRNIVLRLLGGLAIQMLTPELPPRSRSGQDLDFGSVRSSRKPLTELLGEEGYVVELTKKDVDDILRLLVSIDLGESGEPGVIDLREISALTGDDWGWFKTISLNLERIAAALAEGTPASVAGGRLDPAAAVQTLAATLEQAPKSRRWKLRDRIGERKRWYEVPEETPHH